jgi:hypothetical protein
VFTRLRVLRVKIPNVNLATLTEPLIQWFTQLPKRLVRLTELEFSMNTIADILLVCLESFEMSESECKEREHPVEKWTVSFTDSKKIERVMVDAVGESGDKGERVF